MQMANMFISYPMLTREQQEFNVDTVELDENYPKAEQPARAKVQLKQHQLTLLQRLIDYESNRISLSSYENLTEHVNESDYFTTKIGVIADRVGSGKSYVVLSLILTNDITTKDTNLLHSCGNNNLIFSFKEKKKVINTNMLVIPHNLCSQWEKYVTTFCDIKACYINKTKAMEDFLKEELEVIQELDLIVVTATYYNRVAKFFEDKSIKLQRVFFDEVDNLNIPRSVHICANFYWFVTASYANCIYPRGYTRWESSLNRYVWYANGIKNSGFIKHIFEDLYSTLPRPFMKVLIVKNSEAYIQNSISWPEMHKSIILSKTPSTIRVLHGIVDKSIIDCLNAGDIAGALSHINPNSKGTEESIITHLIDKYNKQMSNLNIRIGMTRELIYDNERDRDNDIMELTKKVKELEEKIQMITDRIQNNDMCAICYDEIADKTVTQCCQNAFCFKCIHIWLSNRAVCPLCKTKMNNTNLFYIDNTAKALPLAEEEDTANPETLDPRHDKKKNFEVLIKSKRGGKILIFSNYDSTFSNIIPILRQEGFKFDYIKGNGNQIRCTVDRYKSTALDVLLVNPRNYGTGMNLENTTDIIMFHKFDTQLESQVIGRAYRMGRIDPLNVYYLLYENETNAN